MSEAVIRLKESGWPYWSVDWNWLKLGLREVMIGIDGCCNSHWVKLWLTLIGILEAL